MYSKVLEPHIDLRGMLYYIFMAWRGIFIFLMIGMIFFPMFMKLQLRETYNQNTSILENESSKVYNVYVQQLLLNQYESEISAGYRDMLSTEDVTGEETQLSNVNTDTYETLQTTIRKEIEDFDKSQMAYYHYLEDIPSAQGYEVTLNQYISEQRSDYLQQESSVGLLSKCIILGAVAGIFLSVFGYVVVYMFSFKIRTAKEVEDTFGLITLIEYSSNRNKSKFLSKIDSFIERQRDRFIEEDVSNKEEMFKKKMERKGKKQILILGEVKTQIQEKQVLDLIKLLQKENMNCVWRKDIEENIIENVIILIDKGHTSYRMANKEMRKCEEYSLNILGTMIM